MRLEPGFDLQISGGEETPPEEYEEGHREGLKGPPDEARGEGEEGLLLSSGSGAAARC